MDPRTPSPAAGSELRVTSPLEMDAIRADPDRLAALRATGLLSVDARPTFDRITRLAVAILNVPAAFLTLVEADRDVYVGAAGLPEPLATTRELTGETFCHHAISGRAPLVIEDVAADAVYRDVPTVRALGVAAYVGVPLVVDGHTIGSFCAIDTAPHAWTSTEIEVLAGLADSVLREIALRHANALLETRGRELELANARLRDQTAELVSALAESDRARGDAELRGATLGAVIESMPDAVVVARDHEVVLANVAALAVLGVPSLSELGTAQPGAFPLDALLLDSTTGAPLPLDATRIGRAMRGAPSHGQFLLLARGTAREPRPVRAAAAPILAPDGSVTGIVAVVTDMAAVQRAATERDRLLTELGAERTLLSTVLDQLPAAVFVVEAPSGRVIALNGAVAHVWGEPRPLTDAVEHYSDEWVGYHGDGRRIASEEWPVARAARGETVRDWTGEIVRADGSRALIEVSATPVRDAEGRTVAAVAIATDITARAAAERERERLLRELEVERARLAYVFRQAPAFLAVVRGPSHVFELVNAAYTELIGGRAVVGQPILEAVPEVRDQGFVELLDRVLATGEPFFGREMPVVLARTPGAPPERRFVDFSYLPVIEADGTRSGVIAHGTDVTAQVEARHEIERLLAESERERADADAARREAESANRSKSEFLAIMSHELRTPLNAIGGYAELIELGIRGPVTEQQRADLGRIQKSQQHLLGLINGVLNYAKVDAGAVHYEVTAVPLGEVLATCEALISPQASAKRISLAFAGCEGDLHARADREKVQQIVLNLLSNAVKFTDAGGHISLSCARAEFSGGAPDMVVKVTDTGRGIPAADLERVFQPFVQIDAKLTRTQEGTGLGLAISRDLARGMGGDLTLESTATVGSTFTLTLPHA